MEIAGQRVDKKVVTKHTCSKCGEGSAYCCATRRHSKDSAEVEENHKEHHQKIADERAEKEDDEKGSKGFPSRHKCAEWFCVDGLGRWVPAYALGLPHFRWITRR